MRGRQLSRSLCTSRGPITHTSRQLLREVKEFFPQQRISVNARRHETMRIPFTSLIVLNLCICYALSFADEVSPTGKVLREQSKHLVTIKDLDPEVRDHLVGRGEPILPGVAILDINGDGNNDIVLLIKNNDKTVKIRFYLCDQYRCEPNISLVVGSVGDTYLKPVGEGSIIHRTPSLPGKSKVVKLKNPAVSVVTFGKSAATYYWDDELGKIVSITTAD